MPSKRRVLIIGAMATTALATALQDYGYRPALRMTMARGLDVLRRDGAKAVIFDGRHGQVDPLEFLLNARDLDGEVPILILSATALQTEAPLPGVEYGEADDLEGILAFLQRHGVQQGPLQKTN